MINTMGKFSVNFDSLSQLVAVLPLVIVHTRVNIFANMSVGKVAVHIYTYNQGHGTFLLSCPFSILPWRGKLTYTRFRTSFLIKRFRRFD